MEKREHDAVKIYFGTAGWQYDDWVGPFYPAAQSKGFSLLEWYSKFYNTVEVNVSYYQYIREQTVEGWVNKIHPEQDFNFILKLNKDFSHSRNYSRYSIGNLFKTTGILKSAERFGGVLAQFPYSFISNKVNTDFLKRLGEDLAGLPVFLELRHKSWLNEEELAIVREQGFYSVIIDMPEVGEAIPLLPIVTGDKAYIRLHGRNKTAWMESVKSYGAKQTYEEQSARYKHTYSLSELHQIKNTIMKIMGAVKELYIIANNHPGAAAAANATELMRLLDEKIALFLPDSMAKSFVLPESITRTEYAPDEKMSKNNAPSLFD